MNEKLPPVLDVCCGSKMFWFDANDERAIFLDKRAETLIADTRPGRKPCVINPDFVGDFTDIKFPDCSFQIVVFDPPHLVDRAENAWLTKKYGTLHDNWKDELRKGVSECFRVLKPGGILIFKWAEVDIPLSTILSLTDEKPLFGNKTGRTGKTHWVVFMKHNNVLQRTPKGAAQNSLFN